MISKVSLPIWLIALATCACAIFLWNISNTLPKLSEETSVCPEPVPDNVTADISIEPLNDNSFQINYQLVDPQGEPENYHAVWYENEAPVSPGGSLGTILIKRMVANPNNSQEGNQVVTPGPISSEGFEIQIVKDYDGSEDKDVIDPRM